jgi:oligopeptide/dipeptide ABC transporter ATP-binding protein
VLARKGKALRHLRSRMQRLFANPRAALNPRRRVGTALAGVLRLHHKVSRSDADRRVDELLEAVGVPPVVRGAMACDLTLDHCRRVEIARALAVEPGILVIDEPVAALDPGDWVDILNLLKDLQRDRALTYLVMTEDPAVARYFCTRVGVLLAGRIVETAAPGPLFTAPSHPYTRWVLDTLSGRSIDGGAAGAAVAEADGEESAHACPYAARCAHAADRCRTERPDLREIKTARFAACHQVEEIERPAAVEA